MPTLSAACASPHEDLRVPLVIGVTGHRDLRPEDTAALADRVHRVLVDLKKAYPNTPLILLSPLAEGADRVAARAALAEDVAARLIVPLPMPRALYEDDFKSTPGSLGEFTHLLGKADLSFELPLVHGNTAETVRAPGNARDLQYEAGGKYIARQSQILIALWDGADTRLTGGTAAIVRFKREGSVEAQPTRSEHSLLEPPECGPVYHIATPRERNPHPVGEPYTLTKRFPKMHKGDAEAERHFGQIFQRMEAFNRDLLHAEAEIPALIAASKAAVMAPTAERDLPRQAGAILDHYAVADALAIRFQRATMSTFLNLHVLVFLAVLAFGVFADYPGHNPLFLLVSLGLQGWAYVYHRRASRDDYQDKYQDYRALAEGLRVRFFWHLAGVADPVDDHYLGKQRTELDWIRNAIRGWTMSEMVRDGLARGAPPADGARTMTVVLEHWVNDQERYFSGAVRRDQARLARSDRLATGSVLVATVIAAVLGLRLLPSAVAALQQHRSAWDCCAVEWIHTPLVFISLLLVFAALVHHYGESMAYAEHVKQYSRMQRLFAYASKLLSTAMKAGQHEAARGHIRELGREALAENGEWVLLHRERPLEVPYTR